MENKVTETKNTQDIGAEALAWMKDKLASDTLKWVEAKAKAGQIHDEPEHGEPCEEMPLGVPR